MNDPITIINNRLLIVLGGFVLALFGLWRNAVWRERYAKYWAAFYEHEYDRTHKLLYKAIGIDACAALEAREQRAKDSANDRGNEDQRGR